MAISVTQPIGSAIGRAKLVLFQPFDIKKWFVLGFCAFLSQLGGGGASGNFNVGSSGGGSGGGGGGMPPFIEEAFDWVASNVGLVVGVGILAFCTLVALGLLVLWLSSRGKFMFLDGVVRNRGAVVEPWHEFRDLGNSLFGFRVVLWIIGFAASLVIGVIVLGLAWNDIQTESFGPLGVLAIVAGAGLFLLLVLAFVIVGLLLEDFVVPAMYLRDVRTMDAWSVLRHELFAGNAGVFVLFYLMKIVLGLAIGIIAMVATCCTCCIAALPYIGTVILLPLFVFMRCYSLYLLEQFGPDWQVFAYEGPPDYPGDYGPPASFDQGPSAPPEAPPLPGS
jgi:hypothetical protein